MVEGIGILVVGLVYWLRDWCIGCGIGVLVEGLVVGLVYWLRDWCIGLGMVYWLREWCIG